MTPQTLTTIEKLEPGDIFTKANGGFVYIVIDKEKLIKNKKLFAGKIRRIDQQRPMLFRPNIPVIFISKYKKPEAV